MQSAIGIEIDAPPELVYRLARDVTRWRHLLPHYVRSDVLAKDPDGSLVCDFVARRPFVPVLGLSLPVAWRSRTSHDPATRRLRFVHTGGATRGMAVTWTIEALEGDPDRTRVEIAHDFRPRAPGFAAFVDRFFTRPIAGRTLATFKSIAEAVASGTGNVTVTSESRAPTNDMS